MEDARRSADESGLIADAVRLEVLLAGIVVIDAVILGVRDVVAVGVRQWCIVHLIPVDIDEYGVGKRCGRYSKLTKVPIFQVGQGRVRCFV